MSQPSPSLDRPADHGSPRRGRKKRPAIAPEQVVGRRDVRALQEHLQRLRGAYAHGNRLLHFDNLLVALLLSFYNPTCRSLRTIEGLSHVAQEEVGLDRLCRSTTSDALALFDPALLRPVIADLHRRLPALGRADPDLQAISQQILAADGSYFNLYADVAWAIHLTRSNGQPAAQMRLDLQLDVRNWTPMDLAVSGQEQGSETAAVAQHLQPNVIYLADRNYVDFRFMNAVLDRQSDFVIRARANAPSFLPQTERPLTDRDRADGVQSDALGLLPGRHAPQRPLRQLLLADPQTGRPIRVLTSLLDLPAHVIGLLYRRRWQIELFFRWLKVWANFTHLFSHSQNGLTIQFYVAVIAALQMYVATGHRVSKYAVSLLSFVAAGQATLEQIGPILERRQREADLERQRLARKRAAKLIG